MVKRRKTRSARTKRTPNKKARGKQRPRGKGERRDWKTRFVRSLEKTPVVGLAAKSAGIGRQYAYQVREKDKEFAEAWDEAVENGLDQLEAVLHRKARTDRVLLIFTLKSRRRQTYGEKVDLGGQVLLGWNLPVPGA